MTSAVDDVAINNITECAPTDRYIFFIADPMNALLIAASQAVAAGYTVEQAKDALNWFMWAAERIQEQTRDAEL